MYALVDCNSFFASCEQIFRPDLRQQPVVVLSNNDGCVVARSAEAKRLQVPNLQPYFKIQSQLQSQGVHAFSSNYELYGDISHRVMQTLQAYSPELEVYSIDECFLHLAGMQHDNRAYGQRMKARVWRDIRMPVCVGIAATKTLAKLANHIAKKSKKLQGVCVLPQDTSWDAVLKKLPVSAVWGVGDRLAQRLSYLDITTVYALKSARASMIRQQFGVTLERTVAELNGDQCFSLETQPRQKKHIYSTRSFGVKVNCLQGLQQAVSQYTTTAAQKLRQQKSLVKTMTVFIETSRFENNPYKNHRVVPLPYPTNDTGTLIKAANVAVQQLYRDGLRYSKAGVGLIEIVDVNPQQYHFFHPHQTTKSQALMAVVDQLNQHRQQVFFARSGVDPFWAMQRRLKSPSYTTDIDDLVVVHMQ